MTLTSRELQVLGLLSLGLSTLEIGEAMCLSPNTIKSHATRIGEKLKVRGHAGMVGEAFRRGLLQPRVAIPVQRGPMPSAGPGGGGLWAVPDDPSACLRALSVTEADWIAKFDREPEVMWQMLINIGFGGFRITNKHMAAL